MLRFLKIVITLASLGKRLGGTVVAALRRGKRVPWIAQDQQVLSDGNKEYLLAGTTANQLEELLFFLVTSDKKLNGGNTQKAAKLEEALSIAAGVATHWAAVNQYSDTVASSGDVSSSDLAAVLEKAKSLQKELSMLRDLLTNRRLTDDGWRLLFWGSPTLTPRRSESEIAWLRSIRDPKHMLERAQSRADKQWNELHKSVRGADGGSANSAGAVQCVDQRKWKQVQKLLNEARDVSRSGGKTSGGVDGIQFLLLIQKQTELAVVAAEVVDQYRRKCGFDPQQVRREKGKSANDKQKTNRLLHRILNSARWLTWGAGFSEGTRNIYSVIALEEDALPKQIADIAAVIKLLQEVDNAPKVEEVQKASPVRNQWGSWRKRSVRRT